jgi:hypothetical protein
VSNRSITGYHLNTFTIRISRRFSSVREFQMGNFQKYWSQNVGQDFIVLDFFVGGRPCGRKRCVREINVSRTWDPVHAWEKALTRETPAKRGRVNRYGICKIYFCTDFINRYICKTDKNNMGMIKNTNFSCFIQSCGVLSFGLPCFVNNPFLIISFFREAYNVRYSNFKINF